MTGITALLLTLSLNLGLSNQEMRVVVEQALDQPTTMAISDAALHDAFATIADRTGLSVTIGPDALAYLPYGESTRVSARLENIRLRDGIEAMCRQIGMTYRVSHEGLEIVPSAALERLGRAASWEELELIAQLMQAEWRDAAGAFETFRDRVRFDGLPGTFEENWAALGEQLAAAGTGGGDAVLTRACAAMGCTWLPWDRDIIVLALRQQLLYQLQRPVSLRYNSRPLADVVRGLARQAGVPIRIDPASASALPDRVKQSFSLLAEGVTVEEALEQIGVATGLAYEVSDEDVLLRSPDQGTRYERKPSSGQRDPIVGKVILPSADGKSTYEWFIRESDLDDEQNARRAKLIEDAVERMKNELP